ncbi:MAG TPA: phosphodiester glycosidase family protein [Mycobacteriales bacterium]|nr:phosphodiester glycosidase family protein [Mycobacteriales bacterium]
MTVLAGLGAASADAQPDPPARVSPQTSGGELPSAAVMPTGPATPGPRPGTLSVRVGDQQLVCDEPSDPYGGATTQIVYTTPGVTVRKYSKDGRTPLYVIKANLGGPGAQVRPGPLVRSGVSTLQTLRDKFADRGAYVATNGDFFDWGRTGAPWGPEVTRGATPWSGRSAKQQALVIQQNNTATIADVWFSIPIATPKMTLHANSFNSFVLPKNGIDVLTPLWGSGKRTYISAPKPVREYIVRGNVVTAVHTSISNDPVPSDGLIILAQGDAIGRLSYAGVEQGKPVTAKAFPQTDAPDGIDSSIGIGMSLVAGGQYQGPVCSKDDAVARTAVGFMDGGKTMIVAVVQGQTDAAHEDFSGMTAQETTSLMKHLGATDAVMFDGGGSANVVTAKTGQLTLSPDGWDRLIPNGYAFWKR